MLFVLLCACAAIFVTSSHTDIYTPNNNIVADTSIKPDLTIEEDTIAVGAGIIVENIRRQLTHDNYDYVKDIDENETIASDTSVDERLTSPEIVHKSNKEITSMDMMRAPPVHLTNITIHKTITQILDEMYDNNTALPIFSLNQESGKYKMFDNTNNVRATDINKHQSEHTSYQNTIENTEHDDDKHLKRNNNNFSTDKSVTSHSNYGETLFESYSVEHGINTKPTRRKHGRITKQRDRRYSYYQSNKMYRNNRKSKHSKNRHKVKYNYGRLFVNKKHNNSWKHDYKSKRSHKYTEVNERIAQTTDRDNNESNVEQTVDENDTDKTLTDSQDQTKQEDSDDNVYRVHNIHKFKSQYVPERWTNSAGQNIQHDSTYNEHNSRDESDVQEIDKYEKYPTTIQLNSYDIDQTQTTVSGKYKLLKVHGGRGGRRTGGGRELRVLQGRDAQFRLPPSRRQYMHEHVDLRPPLAEHLPRYAPAHVSNRRRATF